LPRSMPIDAMFMDDPPDVNCRAVYATRRRTISLIPISLIHSPDEPHVGRGSPLNREWRARPGFAQAGFFLFGGCDAGVASAFFAPALTYHDA
jgi:hypothetical protein